VRVDRRGFKGSLATLACLKAVHCSYTNTHPYLPPFCTPASIAAEPEIIQALFDELFGMVCNPEWPWTLIAEPN
jgi:hypothetical protein